MMMAVGLEEGSALMVIGVSSVIPRHIGPHCTSLLPDIRQGDLSMTPAPLTPSRYETRNPLIVASGDRHWRPVQTCSLDLTVQAHPGIDTWWS